MLPAPQPVVVHGAVVVTQAPEEVAVEAYPTAHVHGVSCAVPPAQLLPALHDAHVPPPAQLPDDTVGLYNPAAQVQATRCAAPPAQLYPAPHAAHVDAAPAQLVEDAVALL
jgi:hypothetical protein